MKCFIVTDKKGRIRDSEYLFAAKNYSFDMLFQVWIWFMNIKAKDTFLFAIKVATSRIICIGDKYGQIEYSYHDLERMYSIAEDESD